MIEQLFGSKTRVKLLRLFYSNPNRSFYVREITRKIDEQINSVRRELANLLSIGIISSNTGTVNTNNNRLYYEVNQDFEYYQPLSTIFSNATARPAKKSANEEVTENPLKAIGNVELALFTGHFTRDEGPGIDILIVGDVNPTQLNKYIGGLEKQEGRDLRYAVLSPEEFRYRQEVNDRFVTLVLNSKNQVVADKNNLMGQKAPADKEA